MTGRPKELSRPKRTTVNLDGPTRRRLKHVEKREGLAGRSEAIRWLAEKDEERDDAAAE